MLWCLGVSSGWLLCQLLGSGLKWFGMAWSERSLNVVWWLGWLVGLSGGRESWSC